MSVKLLKEVRDFFKENPECWIQGSDIRCLENDKIGHCAYGAIIYFGRKDGYVHVNKYEALNSIERITCLSGYGVTTWNDKPGRTVEEVIALFNEAIGDE